MTLAFDFDDTFTADPQAMAAAMRAFLDAGHTVIVVTKRGDWRKPTAEAVIEQAFGGAVPVVRAYDRPKAEVAAEQGYAVNVWVDNEPESVRA